MSKICRGVKASGVKCTVKTNRITGLCWRHDPTYEKESKTKKSTNEVKAVLNKIRISIEEKYNISYDEYELLDTPANNNWEVIKPQLKQFIYKTVYDFAMNNRDSYPYLKDKSTLFPRHIWQRISWCLDEETYLSLAFTCHKMYQLLVKDKVWYYQHPLNNKILSPKMFKMPLYRIMRLPIPHDLNNLLKEYELPTPEEMVEESFRDVTTDITENIVKQKMGVMVKYLIEKIIQDSMETEYDIIQEVVPGSGIFNDIPCDENLDLEFIGATPKIELFKTPDIRWLIAHSPNKRSNTTINEALSQNFVGYHKEGVYRLLRVQ